jgi:hypothetical protein
MDKGHEPPMEPESGLPREAALGSRKGTQSSLTQLLCFSELWHLL